MPVEKFESFEDAREALWGESGDPRHLRRVAWLWAFSARLHRSRFPPGIHRYATIEEAKRQRDEWEGFGGGEMPLSRG
jgi:hypothetical protein